MRLLWRWESSRSKEQDERRNRAAEKKRARIEETERAIQSVSFSPWRRAPSLSSFHLAHDASLQTSPT